MTCVSNHPSSLLVPIGVEPILGLKCAKAFRAIEASGSLYTALMEIDCYSNRIFAFGIKMDLKLNRFHFSLQGLIVPIQESRERVRSPGRKNGKEQMNEWKKFKKGWMPDLCGWAGGEIEWKLPRGINVLRRPLSRVLVLSHCEKRSNKEVWPKTELAACVPLPPTPSVPLV